MSIGLAHLNCVELVELVTAYLEGEIGRASCRERV